MKYKELILKQESKNLNVILKKFNQAFSENEVQLKFNNNNLLLLREVDINKLRRFVNNQKNDLDTYLFLSNILTKIESIKNYGLSNGKRNYTDYNKERKVINRKQKEEKRGIYYYAQDNNFKKKITNYQINLKIK